ncbi:hypothetical protein FHS29_006821 [Saccharothrix tamanrassetensis]|uniref:SEFIR domain-containing protein n=1 Tax=Saccharothrix tamanrassetensis TaxID=1051531 RepID=A0A841CVN2_9PSEU|nr:SEFIR domain-containing protein [Saccharothrix tamanrassetensis]MBB5960198.1 hypothetical protein [Saccharothrix tamanrassetensis]
MTGSDLSPKVFVSYSHDSPRHKELVRRFSTFLRVEAGIDTHLDQWYEDRRRDWSAWASRHLREADFIMVIASPAYKRRAEGLAPTDEGRGAQYEAAIIRDNLTRNLSAETERVLPVVLPGRSVDEIPDFLCAHSTTHYVVREFTLAGIAELLVALTGVPRFSLPSKGRFVGSPFAGTPFEGTPFEGSPAAGVAFGDSPVGHSPLAATRSGASPVGGPPFVGGAAVPETSQPRRPLPLTSILVPVVRGRDIRLTGARIDGEHYGDSIVLRPTLFASEARGVIEFDLGRRFRRFEVVAGVLDDATEADQVGCFETFHDGVRQPRVECTLGRPARIVQDVSRVLRLRLVAYRPDTVGSPLHAGALSACGRSARLPELAWGNPTVG